MWRVQSAPLATCLSLGFSLSGRMNSSACVRCRCKTRRRTTRSRFAYKNSRQQTVSESRRRPHPSPLLISSIFVCLPEVERTQLEQQMSHVLHSQAGQLASPRQNISSLQKALQDELAVSQNRIAEQVQYVTHLFPNATLKKGHHTTRKKR